jgi:hypothetical protein
MSYTLAPVNRLVLLVTDNFTVIPREMDFKEHGYFNPKADSGQSLRGVPKYRHRRQTRALWDLKTSAVLVSHGGKK